MSESEIENVSRFIIVVKTTEKWVQNIVGQIEKQIEQPESVLKNVEDDLSKTDYKDKIQYNSALNRYEQEKAQLDSLYKKWEEKSEVLLKTEFH